MAEPTHIGDLTSDPANRRKHNPRNVGMLVDALHEVGAARSIVIDEAGVVLAGNAAIEAAAEAGITRLRVVDVDGDEVVAVRRSNLSADQKRALAIYDNRVAELAEWSVDQLRLDAAAGLDLDTFFSAREQAKLFGGGIVREGHTDPDTMPAPRASAVQVGDLFACGRHRVLCGDTRDQATLVRLLGSEQPALVWGDPPYGIALDNDAADRRTGFYGHGHTAIDARSAPWDGALVVEWITRYAAALQPGGYLASWSPYQGIGAIERAALDASLLWLNLFTWAKENPPPGFPEYLAKSCEHAAIFRKPGAGRYVGPELVRDYVVAGAVRGEERAGHPSPKPVDVIVPVVGKLTPLRALIVDPFLGTGTMLVVAERTDRVCYGIDLDPVWVQVALDRWEAFTGERAQKVG